MRRQRFAGTLVRTSVAWLVLTIVVALAAPLLAGSGSPFVPFGPDASAMSSRLMAPDATHRLGTDELGRDVLARLIHGARVSLIVGFVAAGMSFVLGTLLGAAAGYFGGVTDWIISRAIEVVLCFPFAFLVLAIVALFRPSIYTLVVALAISSWPVEARLVRGEMMRIRDSDFATAARAAGAGDMRIVLRHLLPNAIAPVIVSSTFGVSTAILTESALSFLGLGVPLPTASWGNLVAGAQEHIEYAWWLVVFPGAVIFLTAAALNVIGDHLRDLLDPRTERTREDAGLLPEPRFQ